MEQTRKLASWKPITYIKPIEGADQIECAIVDGGWPVVVKKGEFTVGEFAVYFEIDSWIPTELAPFLSKGKEPREYNGVKGEKLRTVRLRKQLSQGLLLHPESINITFIDSETYQPRQFHELNLEPGQDLTEMLGIQKWEAPISAQMAGIMRGNFPMFIPKTDQERCQNLRKSIFETHENEVYEVTVKLDGSSMTVYVKDDYIGVCSRNIDLKETEDNSFWKNAHKQNIIEVLKQYHTDTGRSIAIQGELIGESIQSNYEKITGQKFYVFDIYDIDAGRYMSPSERAQVLVNLTIMGAYVPHVPTLESECSVSSRFANIDEILQYAEGPSMVPTVKREGVVFKSTTTNFSFKAISNSYLLKQK